MPQPSIDFARMYGSHPLHLLTLVAGFALLGYVIATVKPAALWNPNTWWQSILSVVRGSDHRPRPGAVPHLRAGRPDLGRRQSV